MVVKQINLRDANASARIVTLVPMPMPIPTPMCISVLSLKAKTVYLVVDAKCTVLATKLRFELA